MYQAVVKTVKTLMPGRRGVEEDEVLWPAGYPSHHGKGISVWGIRRGFVLRPDPFILMENSEKFC